MGDLEEKLKKIRERLSNSENPDKELYLRQLYSLEKSYDSTGDVKRSTEEVTDKLMTMVPEGFMPRDIIAIVVGQMLRYIVSRMST